ncbi:hypothetical protein [Loigolactobacillus zhaoyuanensis]|uniref:hypothetical protein n=1 Tax=Loigolactobacillus zhaoyuanensis TaxID=2486017 RepID=UPI000F747B8D|nr:hypothetical protein [Loigolactobacillus zhaoyuanensis]
MKANYLFFGIMLLLFFGVCLLDWHWKPFDINRQYVSLKLLGIIPALMFIVILFTSGTKFSGALGVLYHLIIIAIIPRLKAPTWAKMAGYGWITLDVACGIMTMANVAASIAMPVRLGGHVLCAIWIISVCLFTKSKLLKYLGFFIAAWLGVYSFFGGVLPMSYLAIPGLLVVVWLALLGFLYQEA